MKLKSPYLIKPHAKVKLSRMATVETGDFKTPEVAAPVLAKHREQLTRLQDVFYASQQRALLIVLQGMDTAGKDGTIRHIFSGINPQGCDVAAFKVPTPLEARHDFLWRVHQAVPPRGMIGIFNRSHYEDVLSPRVHKLISANTVRSRLEDINEFERTLFESPPRATSTLPGLSSLPTTSGTATWPSRRSSSTPCRPSNLNTRHPPSTPAISSYRGEAASACHCLAVF